MDNLIQFLTPENAEVIWYKKSTLESNKNVDFFYAFCKIGDFFYSLHLNKIHLPYVTPSTHIEMSNDLTKQTNDREIKRNIVLSKYCVTEGRLKFLESNIIHSVEQGEDPRIVSNGKNAWAVIHNNSDKGINGWGAVLLDLCSLEAKNIIFKDENIRYGKNWQPFIYKDQLFAVHELNPFRIIKIDVDTGIAKIVYEAESYLPIFSTYDSYPLVRGGSNTIIWNDSFIGLGHATSEVFRHHPFIWTHTKKIGTTILFIDLFYHFTKHGYSLIDPTSLFEDEESVYVGLDCHERDRKHEQKVLHILLKFNKNILNKAESILPLLKFLETEPVTEQNGVPNLSCHRFFCSELPSAVLYEQARGVRASIGLPGHIVHGPYLPIVNEGSFSAELSYFTKNDQVSFCGVFEIVAHRKNQDGKIKADSTVYLAQSELEATAGVLVKKKLVFSTDGKLNNFLEFRVFANTNSVVCVIDIVTRILY